MIDFGDKGRRGGLSRRNFIKRVIGATSVIASAGYWLNMPSTAKAQEGPSATASSLERLITLNINGTARRVDVPKHETLAMTLRYRLGLTGTKLGCDRAECGNCTVLIDDVAHYACSALTHTMRNRNITTIEGVSGGEGTLHPIQEAFMRNLASQCGFCTPGMVMSAVGLLKAKPNPSDQDIVEYMEGNLCRCGTYDNVFISIKQVAGVS